LMERPPTRRSEPPMLLSHRPRLALLKPSIFPGGEEHEVMRQNSEQALPLARLVGARPQGRAQQPLVSAKDALRLPALPIDPPAPTAARLPAEPTDHLPAGLPPRPLPPGPAAGQ